MMLWIVLTVMTAVAVAGLAVAAARPRAPAAARGTTVGVLKGQLEEIETQSAAGTLAPEEAEGLRIEVKRRLLAEGREAERPARRLSERTLAMTAVGLAAVVALTATGLYAMMGRPDLRGAPATQAAEAALPGDHPVADVNAMIGQLEAKMKQTPDDPEGWRMLGWSYMQTGRNADAATAYGRAALIDPKAEYLSAQGEALALAANGQVTQPAQAAFRKALASDPADPRARYFLAVAKDQGGDRAGAMDDWIALLASAPPGAPWAAEVRAFVEKTAGERGLDISARLPAAVAVAAGPAAVRGPTESQVATAAQMPEADRQAMIAGMVESLATRLKTDPNDAEGWIRLMRTRMVLGQGAQARRDLDTGRAAFAGDPAKQAALRAAARELRVPGA